MARQLIIDYRPVKFQLEEAKSGRLVAKGLFAQCGVPTQNGRVYTQPIYEREIGKLKRVMEARRAYGELDHPADGTTKLSRVSHIVTNLQVQPDGSVLGEAEILNTPSGNTLRALIEAGCEVGVSSRGVGSTKRRDDGTEEVNEDFKLKTFDFVAEPAAANAFPEIFAESVEPEWDADMIRSEFPELLVDLKTSLLAEAAGNDGFVKAVEEEVAKREAALREDIEKRLRDEVAKIKEAVQREFQESIEADPKEQRATAMLAHVAGMLSGYATEADPTVVRDALQAKDLEVQEAREEADEIYEHAQLLTRQLLIERMVGGLGNAEAIRSLFPDPSAFELDELQEKLDEAIENFGESISDTLSEATEQDYVDQMQQYEAMISELQSDKKKLKRGLRDAINERTEATRMAEELQAELDEAIGDLRSAGQQLEEADSQLETAKKQTRRAKLTARKEQAASRFTNAPELRSVLEHVDTEDGVDEVVEQYGRSRMSDPLMERIRQRVKRGRSMSSASRTLQEDLDGANNRPANGRFLPEEQALLGETMSNLKVLSGIKPG